MVEEIRGIPSDITGANLDQLLEANFPGEGGKYPFRVANFLLTVKLLH